MAYEGVTRFMAQEGSVMSWPTRAHTFDERLHHYPSKSWELHGPRGPARGFKHIPSCKSSYSNFVMNAISRCVLFYSHVNHFIPHHPPNLSLSEGKG